MIEMEQAILEIDCNHIYQHDVLLYKQLENYPSDVIPTFDLMASECFREQIFILQKNEGETRGGGGPGTEENIMRGGEGAMNSELMAEDMVNKALIQIRPYNMKKLYKIREMDPTHIDKLVTIKGIVIRNSDIIPEMKEAVFRCENCGEIHNVFVQMGKVQEPDMCKNCRARQSFQLIHN